MIRTTGVRPENNNFDRVKRFPEKLWDAVNDDNSLLQWSQDGTCVIVNEMRFTREILTFYPGLVQITSFANFRRQMREYGFEWKLVGDGEYAFIHPNFNRGRADLLPNVKTRRKSNPVPGIRQIAPHGMKIAIPARRGRGAKRSLATRQLKVNTGTDICLTHTHQHVGDGLTHTLGHTNVYSKGGQAVPISMFSQIWGDQQQKCHMGGGDAIQSPQYHSHVGYFHGGQCGFSGPLANQMYSDMHYLPLSHNQWHVPRSPLQTNSSMYLCQCSQFGGHQVASPGPFQTAPAQSLLSAPLPTAPVAVQVPSPTGGGEADNMTPHVTIIGGPQHDGQETHEIPDLPKKIKPETENGTIETDPDQGPLPSVATLTAAIKKHVIPQDSPVSSSSSPSSETHAVLQNAMSTASALQGLTQVAVQGLVPPPATSLQHLNTSSCCPDQLSPSLPTTGFAYNTWFNNSTPGASPSQVIQAATVPAIPNGEEEQRVAMETTVSMDTENPVNEVVLEDSEVVQVVPEDTSVVVQVVAEEGELDISDAVERNGDS